MPMEEIFGFTMETEMLHTKQRNIHKLINSVHKVDNRNLALVCGKSFFKVEMGLNNS